MKIEPAADIRQMAHTLRELFVAMEDEGFTEQQAMTIVGQVLAANIIGGGNQ